MKLPKGRRGLLIIAAVIVIAGFLYLRHRSQAAAGLMVAQQAPDVPAWPGSPYYPGQTGGGGSVGVDLSPSGSPATGPASNEPGSTLTSGTNPKGVYTTGGGVTSSGGGSSSKIPAPPPGGGFSK